MRLLVTRPLPDAEALEKELTRLGHEVLIDPAIAIELLPNLDLPFQKVQAIIATSKNGLRALEHNKSLAEAVNIPLFAVGQSTAACAQALNFSKITVGPGTAHELAHTVSETIHPQDGPLLHLAGEHVSPQLRAGLENKGFQLFSPVVYKAIASESFDRQTVSAIKSGSIDGVILLSPRTARIFSQLVLKHRLKDYMCVIIFYCLSTAVSEALDCTGETRLRIAGEPRTADIIDLIKRENADNL